MTLKCVKRATAVVALITVIFVMAGCGLWGVDPVECVQNMVDAYTAGNTEMLTDFFEEDDRMQYLIDAVEGSGSGEMQEVYKKVYELTQTAEITVVGESDVEEYVKVKVKSVDFTEALNDAMINAMKDSGITFEDIPGWMMKALNTGGEPVEQELVVRVQADGKLYGVDFNKEFLNALTGGFYDYIGCTLTSCTSGGNKSYMVAGYDQVVYSLDEYHESITGPGMSAGDVNAVITRFKAEYEGLEGVIAGGSYTQNIARLYLIVDYQEATTDSLQKLGLISGSSTGIVSLESSIKGMELNGYTCETTDFGVGVLEDMAE